MTFTVSLREMGGWILASSFLNLQHLEKYFFSSVVTDADLRAWCTMIDDDDEFTILIKVARSISMVGLRK